MSHAPSQQQNQLPEEQILKQRDRSIVLIGLMGAGKSTVGRRLAGALGLGFKDADAEIVEAAGGRTIEDIFSYYGETSFRDVERRVIARLLGGKRHVLATGGGAFMDAQTRALIKERGLSVWLRVDIELLVKRVTKRATRPLLKDNDPRETLERLVAERYPIYAEADITIDSVDGPHEAVVRQIKSAIEEHLQKNDK